MYHCRTKLVQKSKGGSAIRAAAYRAAVALKDKQTGKIYSYTNKKDVKDSFILHPKENSFRFPNRENLWNAAELAEKRRDAQLAREFEFALPVELNELEHRELVEDFAHKNFCSRGLVVDVAIHEKPKEPRNPHVHLLMTTRPILKDGKFGFKDREMNQKKYLNSVREDWANELNQWYTRKGIEKVVSAKSFREQKIDREPTRHIGSRATRIFATTGIKSKTMELNERIRKRNLSRMLQPQPQPQPIQRVPTVGPGETKIFAFAQRSFAQRSFAPPQSTKHSLSKKEKPAKTRKHQTEPGDW